MHKNAFMKAMVQGCCVHVYRYMDIHIQYPQERLDIYNSNEHMKKNHQSYEETKSLKGTEREEKISKKSRNNKGKN